MEQKRNGLFPSGNISVNARRFIVAFRVSLDLDALLVLIRILIVGRRVQSRLGRKCLVCLGVGQGLFRKGFTARATIARSTTPTTTAARSSPLTLFGFDSRFLGISFFGNGFVRRLFLEFGLVFRPG